MEIRPKIRLSAFCECGRLLKANVKETLRQQVQGISEYVIVVEPCPCGENNCRSCEERTSKDYWSRGDMGG